MLRAMAVSHMMLVVLLGLHWKSSYVEGMSLSLNGRNISTDGSGRINVNDIAVGYGSSALICQSNVTTGVGYWYLHPTEESTEEQDRIKDNSRGWFSTKATTSDKKQVRLRRATGHTAQEGVFTCHIPGDSDTPITVGIYYPFVSVSASIEVVSQRDGEFKVKCTSTGGRALRMVVNGPGDFSFDPTDIEAVGSVQRVGNDRFSGTTDVISGGSNGDLYRCLATNGVTIVSNSIDHVMLRVASAPNITSLEQTSSTTVRVEWSQPPGGAEVTGYVVYNISGGSVRSKGVPSSSTSTTISGLRIGHTYTISVEALSQHLYGVSENRTVTIVPLLAAPTGVSVSGVQSTTVSWEAVEDADRYTVTFTQTRGEDQLGLCTSDSHTATVPANTTSASITVGQDVEDGGQLRAYTTYSITVVAVSDRGSSGDSDPITVTTTQTSAAVSPSSVRATAESSTVISVEWNGLTTCRLVNGLIVKYTVKYTVQYTAGSTRMVEEVAGDWTVGGETSLTGLTPFTNYSIQVAAVNDQGHVGVYSDPVTVETRESIPGPVSSLTSVPSFFKITITWTRPEMANGVITAYEVSYWPTDSPMDIVRSSTTDLETSFTTEMKLELGTEYTFTARAYTREGPGESTSTVVTTLERPSAVQGVMVVRFNDTAVTVLWEALVIQGYPNSVKSYTVVYSPVSHRRRRQSSEMSVVFPSTATSGVITGLDPEVTYQFQVFATAIVDNTTLVGERSSPVHIEDNTSTSGSTSAMGIFAGIIVAILVLIVIIIIVILVVYICRKCQSSTRKSLYKPTPDDCGFPLTTAFSAKPPGDMPDEEKIDEPNIETFPDDKHVIEGEKVVFRVKVTGTPWPKLTWYHNGEEVRADYSKELAEDGSITMPSAELKHSGIYQMVAKNKAGSMEKEMKLFVKKEGQQSPHVSKKHIHFSPIPVEEFGEYVSQSHANDNRDFRDQFSVLDKFGNHPTTIGSSLELKPFNRFANITVYDDNRITLRPIEDHSDCQREFINACYIDGYKFRNKFIATQGPLPTTVIDFWRLVWQEKTPTIVMVTNVVEGMKIKCQRYWPDMGAQSYGPFQVTITDQQILADYTTRSLLVQLTGSTERVLKVTQFHFTAWPDHGVPDYATPILAFLRKLKKQHRPSKGPMLMHCSAGVGRTGTLITIDRVLDQIEKERVVDIAGTIEHLRNQRMKMVQSPEQYIFIHDAILEAMTCGDTQVTASDLRRSIQKLSRRDPKTRLTGFESQFKVLEQVSPNPDEVIQEKALENPTKNRSQEFLPSDRWRVVLKGEMDDYINAVVVNGYKQLRAFIIAQSPMESTARDFWKMVHDRKCGVIVMLCQLMEAGEEVCHQYWPNVGSVQFEEFSVDVQGEEAMEGFTIRTLSVFNKKSGKGHDVVQLHMTSWSRDGRCANLTSIIDVIAEMSKVQRRTGNNPIVVHCSDTVSRSGMFCAIATTIEKCKTEGVVDVFQVVKALRAQKPGAVHTVSQFHTLSEAVLVYLDSFDTYGNFQDL